MLAVELGCSIMHLGAPGNYRHICWDATMNGFYYSSYFG